MLFFLMVLHQVAGLIKKKFSAESRKAKIFMPLHPLGYYNNTFQTVKRGLCAI
jgi:hypothetical protein